MRWVEATIYRRSSPISTVIAYGLAIVFVVLAVVQLFEFEKVVDAVKVLLPADISSSVHIIVSAIVVLEVFALPYFLPIPLSKLARWCAMACALVVPIGWLIIMISTINSQMGDNVPLLGSIVELPLGPGVFIPVLAFFALILILTVCDHQQRYSYR